MRITVITILLIFDTGILHAQNIDTSGLDKSHWISVFTGLSRKSIRDDAMSPFIYRGNSIPVTINYGYSGAGSTGTFYISFNKSRLTSSLPDFANAGLIHYVLSTDIQMGYFYLHKVFKPDEGRSNLYFGGEISVSADLRQHAYIDENKLLMLDQFNSVGFKAQLEKWLPGNMQVVSLSLDVPFVSYVLMGNTYNAYVGEKTDPVINYRRNMLLYLVKNGDFISFKRLVYFKTGLSFEQHIGRHIGVEFKYIMRYYKFTQYRDLNYSGNLQHQFLFGIVVKL